jgi:hypothetical protein
VDFKAVFIPTARDILLQRVTTAIVNSRPKQAFERNVAGDIDREAYALHRYLSLLSEGQTVALDMLFAPRWAIVSDPAPLWDTIFENRQRLVSRRVASFVGYCRTQANKYGIKGSRVHAVRAIVEWFDAAMVKHGHLARVAEAGATLPVFIAERKIEHTSVINIQQPGRSEPIPHLECCNRKAPFLASLKDARAIYARLLDEYGSRALQAERNEGVDWKALSHAVRIGHEALEFLATACVTFPLPNASHILAIKTGAIPYAAVAEEIEELLERVEAAQETSILPDKPDYALIDDLVCEAYREAVTEKSP